MGEKKIKNKRIKTYMKINLEDRKAKIIIKKTPTKIKNKQVKKGNSIMCKISVRGNLLSVFMCYENHFSKDIASRN